MKTRLLLLLDIVFVFSRRLPARTNLRLKRHLLGTLRLPPTASRRRSSRTLRARTFYLTSPTSTSEPEQREHPKMMMMIVLFFFVFFFHVVILPQFCWSRAHHQNLRRHRVFVVVKVGRIVVQNPLTVLAAKTPFPENVPNVYS